MLVLLVVMASLGVCIFYETLRFQGTLQCFPIFENHIESLVWPKFICSPQMMRLWHDFLGKLCLHLALELQGIFLFLLKVNINIDSVLEMH